MIPPRYTPEMIEEFTRKGYWRPITFSHFWDRNAMLYPDKEALVEALDTKVQQFLESELEELKGDISNFRDLEVEFAEKEVEMKKKLTEVAKKDMAQLVNVLNEFLDERLHAEFTELREDIDIVKQNKLGQQMFEDYKDKFERHFFNKDEMNDKAKLAEEELKNTKAELNEAQRKLAQVSRKHKLNEVLSALDGRPRELMKAILTKTPTDRLEPVYEQFVGHVLNRSAVDGGKEKEVKVLAENSNTQSDGKKVVTKTVDVSGDAGDEPIYESEQEPKGNLSAEAKKRLREMSGQLG